MISPIFTGCCAGAPAAMHNDKAPRTAAGSRAMVFPPRGYHSKAGGGSQAWAAAHHRVGGLFLPAELSREPRLGDRVAVDHVARKRSGSAARVEPVDLERIQGEVIA